MNSPWSIEYLKSKGEKICTQTESLKIEKNNTMRNAIKSAS